MRILITGGAGFIGSAVVRLALKTGHEVINVDCLTYASCLNNLDSVKENNNYNFVNCDIRDQKKITEILEKFEPDSIMHLAAESHVDRSIDSGSNVLSTNIIGTYVLLDSFTKYWINKKMPDNFRFHHVSTDEVFGEVEEGKKFLEDTKYNPKNPYSASKASSDHLVNAWMNTYDLPAIITNCSNNYGPYQFPEKLIPVVILNALNKKDIPIYGDGSHIRDWIHVDDHADALLLCIRDGKNGERYNIGANGEIDNISLVRMICEILDQKLNPDNSFSELIKFVSDRPGHDRHYGIDASKIISELKWKPKFSLREGLDRTVQWYLSNTDWLNSLSDIEGVGKRLGKGIRKI